MSKEDGGAAYPTTERNWSGNSKNSRSEGMTIRDYFAVEALSAIVSNEAMIQRHREAAKENLIGEDVLLATSAYTLADAMLAERSK